MITKLPHILAVCTVGCISLLPQDSFAQDGLPPQNFQEPSYLELNLNEDKPLLFEPSENRSSRTAVTTQLDSVTNSMSKPKSVKKPAASKKEDDALSFNFLYYIIQKYKISDIVDQ